MKKCIFATETPKQLMSDRAKRRVAAYEEMGFEVTVLKVGDAILGHRADVIGFDEIDNLDFRGGEWMRDLTLKLVPPKE